MKNIIILFMSMAIASPILLVGCGSEKSSVEPTSGFNYVAKTLGGTMYVDLKPGKKFEEVTWKDGDDLWVLTRDMREDEKPEEHIFEKRSFMGVMDGKIVIRESVSDNKEEK